MNRKKICAFVLMTIGVAVFFTSTYIQKQVLEGKGQISQAQEAVKQGNSLFSLAPYGHQIGKQITGSAEHHIAQGEQKIRFYEQVASLMYVGGIILMVIGLGFFGFSFLKR
jgi:hypothetical protein